MKLPKIHVLGNVVRVLVSIFFFTAADFHVALVAVNISHSLTAATEFSSSLFVVFLSLALKISVDLFLFELRWPTA